MKTNKPNQNKKPNRNSFTVEISAEMLYAANMYHGINCFKLNNGRALLDRELFSISEESWSLAEKERKYD